MKNYIVTGGAGFIGSNLAERLTREGHAVHVIDDLSTGFRRNVPKAAVFHKADISRPDEIFALDLPKRIDCVYHLAAQSSGEASFDDPARDIEINYAGTYNVLKLAGMKGAKRIIFSSSMSVYGEIPVKAGKIKEDYSCNPVSYYGCNKLASERLMDIYAGSTGIDYTIFRLFNVYGPGQNMKNMKQGMVSIYLSYLMRGEAVECKGSLARFRDFIYIDDVVDALMACEDAKATFCRTFNLGTSVRTTVKELLGIILKAYGKSDFKRWVKVKGNTAGDVTGCVADISSIKKALRWKPQYDIKTGIAGMKRWLDDR